VSTLFLALVAAEREGCVDYRTAVGDGMRNPPERAVERELGYRTCEKTKEAGNKRSPLLVAPKDRNQLVSTQCRSFCTCWSLPHSFFVLPRLVSFFLFGIIVIMAAWLEATSRGWRRI